MHGRSFTAAAVQVSPAIPSDKAGTVELLCEKVAEAPGNGRLNGTPGVTLYTLPHGVTAASLSLDQS